MTDRERFTHEQINAALYQARQRWDVEQMTSLETLIDEELTLAQKRLDSGLAGGSVGDSPNREAEQSLAPATTEGEREKPLEKLAHIAEGWCSSCGRAAQVAELLPLLAQPQEQGLRLVYDKSLRTIVVVTDKGTRFVPEPQEQGERIECEIHNEELSNMQMNLTTKVHLMRPIIGTPNFTRATLIIHREPIEKLLEEFVAQQKERESE